MYIAIGIEFYTKIDFFYIMLGYHLHLVNSNFYVLSYFLQLGRIHIKASFNSKKKIQGNGDKFPHTIGQRMLLTPWCFYFWQINGRIWEEPEADGGDEHQP